MSQSLQMFDALDPATEACLRESIKRFGVLVPVVRDQNGRVIDGHHRSRIADDMGVKYRVDVLTVADNDEALELARTLNADRRHLSVDQRRQVVAAMRSQGHSLRAIAGATGVSKDTVDRDLAGVSRETPESGVAPVTTPKVRGQDGKMYPSKRTLIAAKDSREADRAQQALATGATMPAKTLDVKRAERIAREHQSEQRRAEAPTEPVTINDTDLRVCSIADLDIDARSVDAIITDPPYPAETWRDPEGWASELGKLAAHALKPGGLLAVLIGTRLEMADTVDRYLTEHVSPRWRGVYIVQGPRWRDQTERVATGQKPVLIYDHPTTGADERRWILNDVWTSDGDDKEHHHWGQSESGIAALVRDLTEPGHLVVDPFLGGGTTAVVCHHTGRRFIGCDIDPLAVSTTKERLG